MKLKDYLTEIFTTDVPLKIEDYTKQSGQWIAKFSVGDIDYVFNAKIMNQVQDIWELTFWVETRELSKYLLKSFLLQPSGSKQKKRADKSYMTDFQNI